MEVISGVAQPANKDLSRPRFAAVFSFRFEVNLSLHRLIKIGGMVPDSDLMPFH
jgi:hypothetical protein